MVHGYYSPITPDMFDPAAYQIIAFNPVLKALQDALVKAMPGEVFGASLAESWSRSPDGLTWEFKLRKRVKFHNGDTVTAADFKFSFDRYKGMNNSLFKKKVREVEVVDDYTVRVHLAEVWPDFLTYFGGEASAAAFVVPKKYIEKVGQEGFYKHPIGAGPYKFVEYKPGERLVLEAFEDYWRKVPSVKRLVFKEITSEATRAAALMAGEIDYAYNISGPLLEGLIKKKEFTVYPRAAGNSFFLDFLDQMWDPKSPFSDTRVRKAVSLAIDRQAIVDAQWAGLGKPLGNVIPPGLTYALPHDPDPYDPGKAKQLLAEAGYRPGSIKVTLYPYPVFPETGPMIANFLQAVGIDAKIVVLEKAAFLSGWSAKKLSGGIGTWFTAIPGNAASRLETFVAPGGTYAYTPKGAVPEFDAVYEQVLSERDEAKRTEQLHRLQQMMIDRTWQVAILAFPFTTVVGPRVEPPGAMGIVPLNIYPGPMEEIRLKTP